MALLNFPKNHQELRERLRWLAWLRWWAMSGALVGTIVAVALDWTFVSAPAVVTGVCAGVIFNAFLIWRSVRAEHVGDNEVRVHMFADLLLLTWLLAWSGGVKNPLSVFYSFHVVLGALLIGRRGALFATFVSGAGVVSLFVIDDFGHLPTTLNDPPELLWFFALASLLISLCYFGLVLSTRLRQQRALALRRQEAAVLNLNLFSNALDAVKMGLEVVEHDGSVLVSNLFAKQVGEKDRALWADMPSSDRQRALVDTDEQGRIIERVRVSADADKTLGAVLYIDRTDELLIEKRHVMLETQATLGRAMQNVAHELNTPLTTMQTLAKDLRAAVDAAKLSDAEHADMSESIDIIIGESQRCRKLTQNLLSTAQTPARGQSLVGQSAYDIVSRALRLLGVPLEKARAQGVPPIVAVDAKTLDVAMAVDGDKVLQIVMNLVQNALYATEEQSERVTIEGERQGEHLLVHVLDRGPGINEEVRKRLFEPYVTTRERGKGTGLGLYVSRQIARELGGDVTLEDREGGGTVATISVRVQQDSPNENK